MTDPEPGKSPDNPWPVRAVATRVAKYIDRLGMVWVEGQLTEIKVRQSTAWMVLRDPAADMSLSVSCASEKRGMVGASSRSGYIAKLSEGYTDQHNGFHSRDCAHERRREHQDEHHHASQWVG